MKSVERKKKKKSKAIRREQEECGGIAKCIENYIDCYAHDYTLSSCVEYYGTTTYPTINYMVTG